MTHIRKDSTNTWNEKRIQNCLHLDQYYLETRKHRLFREQRERERERQKMLSVHQKQILIQWMSWTANWILSMKMLPNKHTKTRSTFCSFVLSFDASHFTFYIECASNGICTHKQTLALHTQHNTEQDTQREIEKLTVNTYVKCHCLWRCSMWRA